MVQPFELSLTGSAPHSVNVKDERILVLAFSVFVLYIALANLLYFLNVISLPLEPGSIKGFVPVNNTLLLLLVVLDVLAILQWGGHRRRKEAVTKN